MMENLALFRTNLLPNAVYEVTIGGIQCASHRGSPSPPRACSSPSALQTSLEICCAFAASFCWQTLLLSAISQWKFNEEWAAIIRPRRPPQPPIISLLCNQIIIIIIIMDISISFQISLNSLRSLNSLQVTIVRRHQNLQNSLRRPRRPLTRLRPARLVI